MVFPQPCLKTLSNSVVPGKVQSSQFFFILIFATAVRATKLSKIQNSPSQSWLGTFNEKYGN